MMLMTPEAQLRSYANLRSLETRASALESSIAEIKRTCLNGGPSAMSDLIAATAELRWQLRQVSELTAQLEAGLGVQRGTEAKPEKPRGTSEPASLRGSTEALSVPDLISTLSTLRKTGTLALHAGDAMFVFEFEQGRIVHAMTNQKGPELRLGTILIAQNKITAEKLQECLAASSEAKALLGTHLVQSATVSECDLRGALDVQVGMIFDRAFALRSARFTFVEGSLSNIAQRTTLNTVHLLLEAARQADECRHGGLPEQSAATTHRALDSILGN